MATLTMTDRPLSSIMEELEAAERDERRAVRTTGRNDLCPCGSGRKFKKCCLGSMRR